MPLTKIVDKESGQPVRARASHSPDVAALSLPSVALA